MLSIITRVGQDGIECIKDLLVCLASQSDQNFEWIVLGRSDLRGSNFDLSQQLSINPELQERTTYIETESNSRGELLNIGLNNCRGKYLVVLDDDDVVTSNFVAEFNNDKISSYGQVILRTVATRKIVEESHIYPGTLLSKSRAQFLWPKDFSIVRHFKVNQTPCFSVAFPVDAIRQYGFKWDPQLSVVEDWDFLLQATSKLKVVQLSAATGIYRMKEEGSRSYNLEPMSRWQTDENLVLERMKTRDYHVNFDELSRLGVTNEVILEQVKKRDRIAIYIASLLSRTETIYRIARFTYRRFFK